jgi:membrane protease subunit HflC
VKRALIFVAIVLGLFVALVEAGEREVGPVVITHEGERKVITRFGEVIAVTEPGLAFKLPGLDLVSTYDGRLMFLNSEKAPIRTTDKERIDVDSYVIWRIADPEAFLKRFPGATGPFNAERQIGKNVGDDVRETIGQYTLTEVLKTKRHEIMQSITAASQRSVAETGIEIVDVRINRTELPPETERSVYARMRAERERLARKHRAEGDEKARTIRAEADRDARVIVANAKRDAEILEGEGDAAATRIYAEAYTTNSEFYAFTRSLEAYRASINDKTTLVLSPNSEFFRFFQGSTPGPGSAGAN